MTTQINASFAIRYPDSDGQPMADNTEQFRWIVTIKEGLEWLFTEWEDVFVAGDLLWYPVEGHPEIRMAPDAMVVFGRPKGKRGSYQQWREGNLAPQVVFEVLSPGNRASEMARKLAFYDRYGVEEYYLYDPDEVDLTGWLRVGDRLQPIETLLGWQSPRLGIRFELETELVIYRPDGERFESFTEVAAKAQQERLRAEQERLRAEQERVRAEQERVRAEQAEAEVQQLRQKLQDLGIS
jgi:Uma2 family endonuclease